MFGFFKKYELTDEVWEYSAYTPEEMQLRQAEANSEKGERETTQGFINDVSEVEVVNPKGYGYRIRALRDIPEHNIRAGDLGGIVSNKDILSQRGGCWVDHDASIIVFGEGTNAVKITDNALIYNAAFIRQYSDGDAQNTHKNHLLISGNAKIGGNASVFFDPSLGINSTIKGNAEVMGECLLRTPSLVTSHVSGRALIHVGAIITDTARVSGNAVVKSSSTIRGRAVVEGNCFIGHGVSVEEKARILDNAHIGAYTAVSGSAIIKGNAYVMESCHIGERSVVSDDAYIGQRSIIGGATLIKGFAVVPESTLLLDDEVISSSKRDGQNAPAPIPSRPTNNPAKYRPVRKNVSTNTVVLVEGIWGDDSAKDGLSLNSVQRRLETVIAEIASYESDIVKILTYPAFTDSTNPMTLDMMMALRKARGMSYEDDPEAFMAAVDDLERKFMIAEANAQRIATSQYTEEDQQKVKKAHQLFAIVLDGATADNEKKQAFTQGFKNLNGVVIVPEVARHELWKQSGLAELEA